MHYLGAIRLNQGQMQASQAHLTESLRLYQEIEDDFSAAQILIDLGYAAHLVSNYAVANNYFRISIEK